jgi:hypothetical protein
MEETFWTPIKTSELAVEGFVNMELEFHVSYRKVNFLVS